MRILCISDTHNRIDKLEGIEEADLLVHAGDFSMQGTIKEYERFNSELGKIKHRYTHGIVTIEGNHDWLGEKNPALARTIITNAVLLRNESCIINGLRVYGSPASPEFYSWAYNYERGSAIKAVWDNITQCDILITHSPPMGILDQTPHSGGVGCQDLLDKVLEVKPKLHVFGHIHHSYGQQDFNGTHFVNAASCNERYEPIHPPILIDWAEEIG